MKFFAVLFLLFGMIVQAADVRFTFALPEMDGRITLGVFDASGKLVRRLHTLATLKDFSLADNGLIAQWDGKNDAGDSLPAGPYFVKGFVTGDGVDAEGEAYHFNDWIEDEASPRLAWLDDFSRLSDGSLVGVGQGLASRNHLFRYVEKNGFLWKKEIEGKEKGLVVANDSFGVLYLEKNLSNFSPESGEIASGAKPLSAIPFSMALAKDRLFLSLPEGITKMELPSWMEEKVTSAPIVLQGLAASEDRLLGGTTAQNGLWLLGSGSWKEVPIPATAYSVSFGKEDTLWIVGQEPDGKQAFAGQFDAKGEFLRSYIGDLPAKKISASRAIDEIALLEQNEAEQRFLVLELKEAAWEIVLEKRIVRCSQFGLLDGKLVPNAGDASQLKELNVQISPGGLSEKAEKITLRTVADETGCWLETSNGLKIFCVSDRAGYSRIVMGKGDKPDAMRVYAGDGAVVSEFLVSGLENIVALDVGEIDLP